MRHEIWLGKEHLESVMQGGEVTFQTHTEIDRNEPISVCLGTEPEIHSFGEKEKCRYYDECPSRSGWCEKGFPNAACVGFLINAYQGLKEESYEAEV